MNGVCPASIEVEENITNGLIHVKYIQTHVGHSTGLNHLNLSINEKIMIARKLAKGIPHNNILDSLRKSKKNSDIRRLHLTTRKDLWNIQTSFGIRVPKKNP